MTAFLIICGVFAWFGAIIGVGVLLPQVFPNLLRPGNPFRVLSLLAAAITAPISAPILLMGRTAQRMRLPLPAFLNEASQLRWLEDQLREQGWEILVSDIGKDRPKAPDALYLHARLPATGQELTVHHHPKGYTYSCWRDISHAIPPEFAMVPKIDPLLSRLPQWEQALQQKRSAPLELPPSKFSRRYELYGHLLQYYTLVKRDAFEPDIWHDTRLAYSCGTPLPQEEAGFPYNFSYLAIIDSHLLLQQQVQSIQNSFMRDLGFFDRLAAYMPDLRELDQLGLLERGLSAHIDYINNDRYPPRQHDIALQLCEDSLDRLKAHHPNEALYEQLLAKVAMLDLQGIEGLLKKHITRQHHQSFVKLARSVNESEQHRTKALALLSESMERASLLPILIKIAKDQRNTTLIKDTALHHWADLHSTEDKAALREQLEAAEPPTLQAIILSLAKVGDEEDEIALLAYLDHKEETVQLAAIEALRQHGGRASMLKLGQLAKDGSSRDVKRAAKTATDAITQRLPEDAGGALSLTDGSEEASGRLSLDNAQEGQLSVDDET